MYLVSPNQMSSVANLGYWCESVQSWEVSMPSFHPNSELFRELEGLEDLLVDKALVAACLDKLVWSSKASNNYFVRSCYELLFQVSQPCLIEEDVVVTLKDMWRLFLNRLTTKDQMLKRGITHGGNILICVLRSRFEEISLYLFLFCVFAMNVWKGVKRWLGMEMVIISNRILSYISFGRWMRKEKENAFGNIIWATTMWFLWIGRNNIIFRGKLL